MNHSQEVERRTTASFARSTVRGARWRGTLDARLQLALLLSWTFLLAIAVHSEAHAGILSGPVLNPANGHSYYLLTKANWFDSQAEALTLSGNLVTVNDAAENAWVYSTFSTFGGTNRGLWIGLNDAATEGSFVWVSGEPVTYTNWATGEPNGTSESEDYAHIESPAFRGPFWNDRNGLDITVGSGRWGVVEVVPEPATLILLAGGLVPLVGAAWRRKRDARRAPAILRP